MYSVLETKQKKWNMLAVWKVWSAPSYPEMFQGIPHKNIILDEYLHLQYIFYKYFCMDLHFYPVDTPSWALKSECSVYI
jgi:hypothetical protein